MNLYSDENLKNLIKRFRRKLYFNTCKGIIYDNENYLIICAYGSYIDNNKKIYSYNDKYNINIVYLKIIIYINKVII